MTTALVLIVGHGAATQTPPPQTPPPASPQFPASTPGPVSDRYTQPIAIFKNGLGTFTKPMSSKNAEAQAYFDQGFQMMYAFAKAEAVRSFRESWKRDERCAICYWGEAWAWGSYLNGAMSASESPYAYAAIQKALSMKDQAPAKERGMIEAMALRYVEHFEAGKRVDQDRAYAAAMERLAAQYPDDLEIVTLYADALFLLEPRRGTRDINQASVQKLHQVLERVLSKDVHHPGACHLYVHATESTVVPGRAEACAEFLGRSIPGASHINHMPSHTWNEVGRWGDSVRANLDAWHSDQKAAIGEGFAIYPEHNLHMLLYAASYDGQGAIAMRAGKDHAKLMTDTMYQVLTMIRFGRFDEVLEVTQRPRSDVSGGMWDFAQGYASLKTGKTDAAREYLDKVKQLADSSKATFRGNSAQSLLGIVGGILEGELERMRGDLKAAIKVLEKAAALQDGLQYDEPEPLPFAAHHWLGAVLIEAKEFDRAEAVYRTDLKEHPHNGWSLLGLQQALAGRGVKSTTVDADLAASWSRSDTWIRASRF